MGTTIYDVARKAGVGIGTVSRAMNNSPQITPQTKERVLRVIRDLQYQPLGLARGLARKKTDTIAVILPKITGYFYNELLGGIQKKISSFGYDMILYIVDNLAKSEILLKKTMQERRVDGILFISLKIPEDEIQLIQQTKTPIVLVDSYHPKLDSITVENEHGAYIATEHLIKMGHRRIGIIDAHLRSMPAKTRLDGYIEALKENNIPIDHNLLVISDEASEEDGFNQEAGYDAMNTLLQLNEARPTAVFVASDIQALGAMKAIREQQLEIPHDVAIVGFDDIEMSEYIGLSTVRQPMYAMGQLAVERLMAYNSNNVNDVLHHSFSTELIIRETCGGLVLSYQ